jgi:hypothetical protein
MYALAHAGFMTVAAFALGLSAGMILTLTKRTRVAIID